MKEVFAHYDFTRVGYYQSVLENAGIQTFVRNMSTYNTMTEIPAPIFYPALCVVQDDDFEEAKRLIKDIGDAPAGTGVDWRCQKCGQEVPSGFELCWNCGETRSGEGN